MQPARIRTPSDGPVRWLFPARAGPHGEALPGKGRQIPKALRKALGPFFPGVKLDRVRVHQGIPPKLVANAGVANPIAMAVRRDIYIAPGYGEWKSPSGLRTIVHEIQHIAQWEKYGDKVYPQYRKETKWRGYWGNRFEREAYRTENAVVRAMATG